MTEQWENTFNSSFIYLLLPTTQLFFNLCIQYCIHPSYTQQTPEAIHLHTLNPRPRPHSLHHCLSFIHQSRNKKRPTFSIHVHSIPQLLTFTRFLIAFSTFLPFANFLQHSAPCVPGSFNTNPKYLNSENRSSQLVSTLTSYTNLSSLPPNTIILILSASTFRHLLFHA